ncbi:MAG: response regulator [Candidatus Electrothrix sp.]
MNKEAIKPLGWSNAGITVKFSLMFMLLLLLILMTASTGYFSLALIKKAEQQIEHSVRAKQLAQEMEQTLEQARRLHSEFLLLYSTLGLAQAHERYAQPSVRKNAQAIVLSIALQKELSRPEVNKTIPLKKVSLTLYLSAAKRFADTSIETVQLITKRAAPTLGLEAQLEQRSLDVLQKTTPFPNQDLLLTKALLHSKEYLISRQQSDMRAALDTLHELNKTVERESAQTPQEKKKLYEGIEQFRSTAERLVDLDLEIQKNFNALSNQEQVLSPDSEELLDHINQQLVRARKSIDHIRQRTAWFMIGIGLFAIFSTLFIAKIFHKNVTGKIIELTRVADEFRKGRLDIVFPHGNRDELGTLSTNFNLMTTRIRSLVTDLEQEGKRNESFYRSLFDHSSSGVAVYESVDNGKNFIFRDINKAGVAMDLVSRDALLGRRVTEIFPDVEKFGLLEVFCHVNRTGQPALHPIALYNDNRLIAWRENRVYKLPTGEVVAVYTDVTKEKNLEVEKKQIEAELQRAQKMQAIGLLAGGVAHDLNNILSGIIGYPELLLMRLPQDSPLRRPIGVIKKSGERAAAVVADLLTVARGVAGVRETTQLNTIILEYLDSPEFFKLQDLHAGVEYQHDLATNVPPISCSPIHIKKCVMNLIHNGAEAIGEHGKISLSTCTELPDKTMTITHGLRQEEHVIFRVCDTGSGIKKEHLNHIFEPFYSKKKMGRSGTGLGLTVVWNTMEDHNGAVTVTSTGKGTTFTLYFPVGLGKEAHADEPARQQCVEAAAFGHGESILVVDDESIQRDLARNILNDLGYHVETAQSGEEAVAMLQDKEVDLLLLDMLMAPGINGCQTYEQILKTHPNQRAIIVSGFSESEDVKKALKLGAALFLKKPYSLKRLGRVVREVLADREVTEKRSLA